MLDGVRRRVDGRLDAARRGLANLPRGVRVAGAIFLVVMWVLGVQYLAADVGIPLARALGASSDAALSAAYLTTFGVLLLTPFVILLDWEFGDSARSAAGILLLMAWFVAADRLADGVAAAFGLPYTPVVVAAFLLPVLVVGGYRFRKPGGAGPGDG
ncbi:hypothetical protein [Haloparvum sp. AD34]